MFGPSPFPRLDAFIASECVWSGLIGSIRCWTMLRTDDADESAVTLSYSISGNRYCHRLQRQHKSNGIYVIVSVAERVYYVKCHDADCRSFRFGPIRIPNDVFTPE